MELQAAVVVVSAAVGAAVGAVVVVVAFGAVASKLLSPEDAGFGSDFGAGASATVGADAVACFAAEPVSGLADGLVAGADAFPSLPSLK
mmetsp:Transcript_42961/g.84396  ORF Transcript_42961/g.84396 Transcript_42961/m.84396 type:complete len:89 (+) Transcript_42961:1636-1902(+)